MPMFWDPSTFLPKTFYIKVHENQSSCELNIIKHFVSKNDADNPILHRGAKIKIVITFSLAIKFQKLRSKEYLNLYRVLHTYLPTRFSSCCCGKERLHVIGSFASDFKIEFGWE